MEENSSTNHQEGAQTNREANAVQSTSEPSPLPEIPAPELADSQQESDTQSTEEYRKPAQANGIGSVEPELKKFERLILKATWAGVIAAALTGAFIWAQFRVMSYQTQILSIQTIDSIAAELRSERSTREQLKIAGEQVTAAQDQVIAIQRQMRQEQRPWVHITENGQLDLAHGTFPVTLTNIGNTPARDVRAFFIIKQIEEGTHLNLDKWLNDPKIFGTLDLIGTQFKGDHSELSIERQSPTGQAIPFDAVEIQELKQPNKAFVVIFGKVIYTDVFGVKH